MEEQSTVRIAMRADTMRSDLVRGLVWFVNYAALDPTAITAEDLDLHGTAMLPPDVEKFAHRWLAFSRAIDIEHDGVGRPVSVVESFFNSRDIASPSFPINSHAARLDMSRSKEAMEGFRTGRLNSVSLDALTFNRVVRLPVAASKSVRTPIPSSLAAWATELAESGYEGVIGVRRLDDGLYIALRSTGLPVAVSIDEESIDAVGVADGPWSRIAMALYSSPTMTSAASIAPVDFLPWSREETDRMLESIGIDPGGSLEKMRPVADEVFAHVTPDGRGMLPHHTVRGGTLMVSKAGVLEALRRLGELEPEARPGAEAHLRAHLEVM